VTRFALHSATLDDVFLELTGHPTPGPTASHPDREALHV
jgi:hypothetical protein